MYNHFFGLTLDAPHTTVMQSVFVDDVTREIFVSQAANGTISGRETTIVSRHTPAGVFIDSMEFVDAGHGTCVFTETDPLTMETRAWLNVIKYETASAGSPYVHQLVRVPWVGGASYTGSSPQVTANKVDTFTSLYTLANADLRYGLVLVRETSGSTETHYLRSISDLKAGIDNRLSMNIVTSTATDVVQGFATLGHEYFIRLLGSSNPGTASLQFYSWTTGELVRTEVLEDLRYEADGSQDGDFSEPEGLSVFRNNAGPGTPFIVVGFSGGRHGRRTYRFGVVTQNSSHPWADQNDLVARHTAIMKQDRSAFVPSAGVTSMAAITRPGYHYLSTAAFDAMTDRPTSGPSGAYMLEVSAYNPAGTAAIQRLTRFSLTGGGEWLRVVDFSGPVAQSWYQPGGSAPAPGDPPVRQSYTPTLSNITLGSGGSAAGEYVDHDGYIDGEVVILLGVGGTSTGTMKVGLPVPGRTTMIHPGATPVARGNFHDVSTNAFVPVIGVPPNMNGTEVQLRYTNSGGNIITGSPFVMAQGDRIVLTFRYPKA